MLGGRQPSVVVWPAGHDLALLGHVLTGGAERLFNDPHGPVEQAQHQVVLLIDKVGNQLPAFERVGGVGGHRAADALSRSDLGHGGAGSQSSGNAGQARLTAKPGWGFWSRW